MHAIDCRGLLSVPVTHWAKWRQQTGRDSTRECCNAVLFLFHPLKENVAMTYHFAILTILKLKKTVWSFNRHILPWGCLWVADQSYYDMILFHKKPSLFLSHQSRLVLAMYGSKMYISIISWSLPWFGAVLQTSQSLALQPGTEEQKLFLLSCSKPWSEMYFAHYSSHCFASVPAQQGAL